MLKAIGLENFKPFGARQVLPLSRITLIYGPNSGGKSSLIQALMLLRQTVEDQRLGRSSLIPRGKYVDLGSFRSLLHRHDSTRELGLSFTFAPAADPDAVAHAGSVLTAGADREVNLAFRAAATPGGRQAEHSRLCGVGYRLHGDPGLEIRLVRPNNARAAGANGGATPASVDVAAADAGHDPVEFGFSERASAASLAAYYCAIKSAAGAKSSRTGADPLEAGEVTAAIADDAILAPEFLPVRFSDRTPFNPRDVTWFLSRVLDDFGHEFGAMLSSVSYLGPLRNPPARHYLVVGGAGTSVGVSGEHAPTLIYRQGQAITSQLNAWFEAFDIPYTLAVKAIGDDEVTGELIALTLVDRRLNTPVSPSDVGFGIGQLLPILVEGALARHRVLCVEQPEIHLHPRLQARLGDFFAATAGLSLPGIAGSAAIGRQGAPLDGFGPNQWLIETHSEALMLRLQRHVREGHIAPDDISVLYVAPGESGSRIVPLRLDEHGEFRDEWPDGFFEESYRELFGRGGGA